MEKPAVQLCERLWASGDQKLPQEILRLDNDTAGIVIDIDGVDYILSMQELPRQRQRPKEN